MELKTLKEEKNTLELEFIGEGHTLCNLLRKELWNNDQIETASYTIKHPTAAPVFIITAKSGKPRKHLQEAITTLKKKTKELKTSIQKL
ncbi:MAG: DNA-directed RNA polymerase subunit L [Candidatus Nanoarchaeia archaeon]